MRDPRFKLLRVKVRVFIMGHSGTYTILVFFFAQEAKMRWQITYLLPHYYHEKLSKAFALIDAQQ